MRVLDASNQGFWKYALVNGALGSAESHGGLRWDSDGMGDPLCAILISESKRTPSKFGGLGIPASPSGESMGCVHGYPAIP